MAIRPSARSLCALALVALSLIALGADSAAEKLKSITDLRESLYTKALEKAKADDSKIDMAAIQKQIKAKAEESIKGVDPGKLDPKEALDWAQIYNLAERPADVKTVLAVFIGSKPEETELYEAQKMLIAASWATKDDKTVAATLQAMKPHDPASKLDYASLVVTYAPHELPDLGADNAIALIDKAIADLNPDGLSESAKRRISTVRFNATLDKIEIYRELGKKDKVVEVIDEAIRIAPERTKDYLTTTRNQFTLVGSPAPPFKPDRGYGGFSGLEALKGKVVLLEFFAQWSAPSKESFPAIAHIYADLHSKGLEVVGVTRYYRFLGDPGKFLSPDEEFGRLGEFVKEQKITWPVALATNETFQAYGVTDVPLIAVISRAGVVHDLQVGYSEQSLADLRKKIETLLEERVP